MIEHVLECVEVRANEPKPHLRLQCVRVHAHGDYDVILFSDAISFKTERDSPSSGQVQPNISICTIKSEKEVRRK